jgi:uncharacterized damage-inducible protein DinB
MTWTAPEVTRDRVPWDAGERTQLDAWLEFHRQTLQSKCAGLTAEQLAERAASPSNLSLIGLIRHMTEVERGWLRGRYFGTRLSAVYCTEESPEADFEEASAGSAERDLAAYRDEIDAARAVYSGRPLDETYQLRHGDVNLRWIYLHMIEEYARHNGHADLLREHIDGVTGI